MINIKLIIIGHSDRVVNFDLIKKYKSKFFKFSDIERIHIIKKIENFILKYPLFSVLVTFFFSTLINLFSNWLWEMIK